MEKLHPKAVWLFFFRFLISSLLVFIFLSIWSGAFLAFIFSRGIISLLMVLIFIFLVIFSYIWARLTYRFWRYELTEDTFKKERGVIRKKYVSIPYERIQNIDIHRGVIDRILGLSELHIQTAGSSAVYSRGRATGMGAEGNLPGLGKDVAEKLREELIKRAKGTKQGL